MLEVRRRIPGRLLAPGKDRVRRSCKGGQACYRLLLLTADPSLSGDVDFLAGPGLGDASVRVVMEDEGSP